MSDNSFGARSTHQVGDRSYEIYRLDALADRFPVDRLPFSLKVLLENLLRNEDGVSVRAADIEALAGWDAADPALAEIAFTPARVLMQDFTGVPAIVDLAAMRDAMRELGGDPQKINPLVPVELVIDHSIIADHSGVADAFERNAEIEYERNGERYQFLRWGQQAFDNFSVVPPNTGICHQVNLEYLGRVVFSNDSGQAYPDTLVGTDSHTTMINGLGVLGWGVGGIEAEAAMLGQPVSMLLPRVVGFKLTGELPEGATATDLVLTVTQQLRKHGVVGKFVEFYGPGLAAVPLANRATIGNMSPEYGSTCAIFPIDQETLRYLEFSGRPAELIELVESYAKEQGLWAPDMAEPTYSEKLELDLSSIEPSIAGPKRPQDRVVVREARHAFRTALADLVGPGADTLSVQTRTDKESAESFPASDPPAAMTGATGEGRPEPDAGADLDGDGRRATNPTPATLSGGTQVEIDHGHVVVAAITSCTNTSNPHVMMAAGLLAQKAVAKGLTSKPWVKTSLAPGSKVVMDYYQAAGLVEPLAVLRFNLVGYGCTTCIGNSGPLLDGVSEAVNAGDLAVCSVLSGNRNFEGRIQPDVRMNYLASPPLVVAYALAGSLDVDLFEDPLGTAADGQPVYLRDIWPSNAEIDAAIEQGVRSSMFRKSYGEVFRGDEMWQSLPSPTGDAFDWQADSTYVRNPPYFVDMSAEPTAVADISGARVLAKLGDSVTTDHISPAGNIKKDSPAGHWLADQGVAPGDFNSYGSRRGNHEVMIRGTFANIRLRNQLAPGTEGGVTIKLPEGEQTSIYDAAQRYAAEGTPLVVLAGKEYGSGSSRDWAAKGTLLLGVRAVIAESYERIHRSNLVGMGILPLQYREGETAATLGLTGQETFAITGLAGLDDGAVPPEVTVRADDKEFTALLRIDTPKEADYYRHGGILRYVLRQLRDSA
ncbi:MAG TPA: aconitate hydratase [Mycobacteriales bacterium]|nr:aconitate hydratase [Mycobacteriales bacterium]